MPGDQFFLRNQSPAPVNKPVVEVKIEDDEFDLKEKEQARIKQEEAKLAVESFGKRIAEAHFHHLPRMSYGPERPESRLQNGIQQHDFSMTISALRDMGALSTMSTKEIEGLSSDKNMLFSAIDEQLKKLDKQATDMADNM